MVLIHLTTSSNIINHDINITATSKLKSLYDQITTNGFRGEAVASVCNSLHIHTYYIDPFQIATVSFLEITTRSKSSHTVYSKLIQVSHYCVKDNV
jgi:hypothetical protein